jgi:UDP-N-acetylglucosamine diphosphorylase/glucosamine-1-phosphate N-acetyltransferase
MNVSTAVVMAAGEGTRLRPLTHNRPKPMLSAGNRPILEHVFDALVDAGVDHLVAVVGYRRARVQEHFGPEYREVPIEYVVQDKQLGSGHALLQAKDVVSGDMLVVNGDRIIGPAAVRAVSEAFETDDAPAAMAVIEREDAHEYGAVTLEDGDIVTLVEKPEPGAFRLINAGIYAFEHSIFGAIEETPRIAGELGLTDTINELLGETRIRGVNTTEPWVDATYPWDMLEVTSQVLASGRLSEGATREGVWVGETATVHEDATLRPPVVVGGDCAIGPGTVVGPQTAVGQNTTLAANVTVERSIVESDGRVDAGATIIDAVVGQNVHIGAGTTIPGGPGDVRVDRTVHEDQSLGAVLGDRVRVGGGVGFDPGTLIGAGASIGTGCQIRGNVPSDSEVVR